MSEPIPPEVEKEARQIVRILEAMPSVGNLNTVATALLAAEKRGETREREKIAEWMIGQSLATGHGDSSADLLVELEFQIREKAKKHWLEWHHKRSEISRNSWLRAAKSALAGDMRDLRNRVDLAEAGPVEIVLSNTAIRSTT